MAPVILPKRKKFGFLKPPSLKILSNQNETSKSIEESSSSKHSQAETIPIEVATSFLPPAQPVKTKELQCSIKGFNLINYNFDSLPQIDEVKYTPTEKFVSSIKIRLQRQTADFLQLKAYQDFIQSRNNLKAILKLPFKLQGQKNNQTSHFTKNKIDSTVQSANELLKERKEQKLFYTHCSNCNMIHKSQNLKCINCQTIDLSDVSWASNRIKFKRNQNF
jgi:hypothetical protein